MFNRLSLIGIAMSGFCSQTMAAGSSELLERMRTTSVKAGPMLPLTKDKFELLTFAMEMGIAASFTDCVSGRCPSCCHQAFYGDEAEYREDPGGVDAVLTIDVGEYCFVTWRGSVEPEFTRLSITDWLFRNLDTETRIAERLDGQGQCRVLDGMYEAYQGGWLEAALEPSIIAFVETCMAKPNKQLVLTGHSQGAGAAVVGAIRFAGYDPLTIALAGPATVKSPSSECTEINPDHVWRVINTELDVESNEITYDIVPYSMLLRFARLALGEEIGASIHLPPDIPNPTDEEDPMSTPITFSQDQYGVAYFSKDQIDLEETYGPSASHLAIANGLNFGVHIMYLPKMYQILAHGSFPLDVHGYVAGTPCSGDAECHFQCINRVCAAEGITRENSLDPDGTTCVEDDQCTSGSCSGCQVNIGDDRCCAERRPDGIKCVENDQCLSGSCSGCQLHAMGDRCCTGFDHAHGTTQNDGACEWDGNCQSGRCTWDFTCVAKLENGESCSERFMNDDDCASGACSWSFRNGWTCEEESSSARVSGHEQLLANN